MLRRGVQMSSIETVNPSVRPKDLDELNLKRTFWRI